MIAGDVQPAKTICVNCGTPVDTQQFDEAGFCDAPKPGERVILARFALPRQYCGTLEYFAQYTDAFGQSAANVETPGIEWLLLVGGRPLYPWVDLRHILNPWGFGSFAVKVRLEEGAVLEFGVLGRAARGVVNAAINRVGARIAGRYWYNPVYGDPVRQRF